VQWICILETVRALQPNRLFSPVRVRPQSELGVMLNQNHVCSEIMLLLKIVSMLQIVSTPTSFSGPTSFLTEHRSNAEILRGNPQLHFAYRVRRSVLRRNAEASLCARALHHNNTPHDTALHEYSSLTPCPSSIRVVIAQLWWHHSTRCAATACPAYIQVAPASRCGVPRPEISKPSIYIS
jgi:hypothetical protein